MSPGRGSSSRATRLEPRQLEELVGETLQLARLALRHVQLVGGKPAPGSASARADSIWPRISASGVRYS